MDSSKLIENQLLIIEDNQLYIEIWKQHFKNVISTKDYLIQKQLNDKFDHMYTKFVISCLDYIRIANLICHGRFISKKQIKPNLCFVLDRLNHYDALKASRYSRYKLLFKDRASMDRIKERLAGAHQSFQEKNLSPYRIQRYKTRRGPYMLSRDEKEYIKLIWFLPRRDIYKRFGARRHSLHRLEHDLCDRFKVVGVKGLHQILWVLGLTY